MHTQEQKPMRHVRRMTEQDILPVAAIEARVQDGWSAAGIESALLAPCACCFVLFGIGTERLCACHARSAHQQHSSAFFIRNARILPARRAQKFLQCPAGKRFDDGAAFVIAAHLLFPVAMKKERILHETIRH